MSQARTDLRTAALLAALCGIPSAAAHAVQGPPTARVDSLVTAQMQRQHIPGVSLAVVRDGRVVLARGYGLANVELQVPVRPETIFQSGSVGKQFTATAVMMLVEAGKLSLEDPVTWYFTDAPEAWKAITIRRLLTHTAGTTDYPDDFDFRKDYTEDELLHRAYEIPLAFQPGERWSYSNMGYLLLGVLIHKVSGQFYGDFLHDRVFVPLGMDAARIISEADIVPNRAAGYRLVNGELKNQEWVSPSMNTTADGSLYLNALDMAKWDAALYTEQLLKRSSFDQMWTPVTLNSGKTQPYGFGWSLGEVRGHRIIEHGGSWQGFRSYIARYVDQRLTVIAFANLAEADPGKLAHGVAALYDPELEPPPAVAIPDTEPRVTALMKDLLQALALGSADTTRFTPEMRSQTFPSLAEQAGEFLKPLGALQALELLARTEEGGNRIYRYRARYADASLGIRLTLTGDGKIAGLGMQPE